MSNLLKKLKAGKFLDLSFKTFKDPRVTKQKRTKLNTTTFLFVTERTYCELEWYRLPENKARGIILVMIASNMPTKITAGKLIDLSLKTFGDILKTAAAYLNVLRSVT